MNIMSCTPGQTRVVKLRVPILMHLLTPELEVVREQVRHNRTLRSLCVSYNVSVDDYVFFSVLRVIMVYTTLNPFLLVLQRPPNA
jgi:hypothetical protein